MNHVKHKSDLWDDFGYLKSLKRGTFLWTFILKTFDYLLMLQQLQSEQVGFQQWWWLLLLWSRWFWLWMWSWRPAAFGGSPELRDCPESRRSEYCRHLEERSVLLPDGFRTCPPSCRNTIINVTIFSPPTIMRKLSIQIPTSLFSRWPSQEAWYVWLSAVWVMSV